jgi:hypothetical protein
VNTYQRKKYTIVGIRATPSEGYELSHWTLDGKNEGNKNPYYLTIQHDHEIVAYFQKKSEEYNLTISTNGFGYTSLKNGAYSYQKGSQVTIKATPLEISRFHRWYVYNYTYVSKFDSSSSLNIIMDRNHSLIAYFTEKPLNNTITFQVQNQNKNPISDTIIHSIYTPEKQEQIELITLSNGLARTGQIYPGTYIFNINKTRYNSESIEITLQYGEHKTFTLTLFEEVVDIELHVKDSNGHYLDNVTVFSIQEPVGQETISGTTNEKGVIRFEDVKPGSYMFTIQNPQIENKTIQLRMQPGDEDEYYFDESVNAFCNLVIRVEDSKGIALEDVMIKTLKHPSNQIGIHQVFDHEILLPKLFLGEYVFEFSKEGYIKKNITRLLNARETYKLTPIILEKEKRTNLESLVLIVSAIAIASILSYIGLKYYRKAKSIHIEQELQKIEQTIPETEQVIISEDERLIKQIDEQEPEQPLEQDKILTKLEGFELIWDNIVKLQGEVFYTKTGLPFTYVIEDIEWVYTSRSKYPMEKKELKEAFKMMPVSKPSELKKVVDSTSYAWGILNDKRILSK